MFVGYKILGWQLFISVLEKCCATSCFSGFRWEIPSYLYYSSSISNVSISSGSFEDFFSLSLVVITFIMLCLGKNFFGFILFQGHSASWVFDLWKFSVIMYFKNFFQRLTLFLLLWDCKDRKVSSFGIVPQPLWFCSLFFRIFSLFCLD